MLTSKLSAFLISFLMVFPICGCQNEANTTNASVKKDISSQTQPVEKATELELPKTDKPNGNITVSYIDVGQGDCEFIELPDKRTILIDGGERKYSDKIINYIKNKGYSKIDFLIATHPHADHIGGLSSIIETFEIGNIYMPKKSNTTKTFEKLLDTIAAKNYKINEAKADVELINTDNLKIKFLAPVSSGYKELNNYSAVLRIEYCDTSFLFMGDAENISENEILSKYSQIKADVIKIGHHGSSSSSSIAFIKAVNPMYGVISCGINNKYGHPHNETISTLNSQNVTILRTDVSSTIEIVSDGEKITTN